MKNFTKVLACLMSVAILVATISVAYSVSAENNEILTDLPWTEEYVIEKFDSTYDVSNTNGPFGAYGGVTRDNFKVTDGVLYGNYGSGSGDNDNGFVWVTKVCSPEKTDDGVKFDIDASNTTEDIRIRILLSVEGLSYLQPTSGTVAFLKADDGTVSTVKVDRISTFSIPAGFKGTAGIYFNSFFEGGNDKIDNQKLYERSTYNFQIRVFDVAVENTKIGFDNIAYISNTKIHYNRRIVNDFSSITTSNIAGWRDGNGTPTYKGSENISVVDGTVVSTYPVIDSGNRMFTNIKLGSAAVLADDEKYISIDVDASAFKTTSPKLQIRINNEGTSDYVVMADGTKATLIAEDNTVMRVSANSYASGKGTFINLPVGFKGTVMVKVEDISTAIYDYTNITFGCNVIDLTEAASIVYDNLCYYTDSTVNSYDYSKTIVSDFSSFTTTPTAWRANASSEPYFTTTDNLDYTGGNIKVSYPLLTGTEMTWELKLGTTSLFTAADKAVSIDIDASKLNYSPKLQLQFRQLDGSYYRLASGSTVYFVAEDGTITTVASANYSSKGAYASIPAGFKGTAMIALSDFTDTNATDGSDVYDITNLVLRALIIDAKEESEIIYDNLCYYKEAEYLWNKVTTTHDFSSSNIVPSAWSVKADYKPTLSTDDGSLTVTYVPTPNANETTFELKLGATAVFADTDKAISIDIDTSSVGNCLPKLQLQFRQLDGSYYRLASGSTVYFVAEDGTITTVASANYSSKGAYASIPAGFKGTAMIALSDFTDTNATDGSDVYDITNLVLRALIIDVDTENSSVIKFDNIRYYGDADTALEGKAQLWFAVTDSTTVLKAANISGLPEYLEGKVAVLVTENVTATSAGYVYYLAETESITESEILTTTHINNCKYTLVRKLVEAGEELNLSGALILNINKAYFGTDSQIRLGDCNSDKRINVVDLVRLKKYLANKEEINIWFNAANMCLDAESSNVLDSADLVMLRKYLVSNV